MSKVKPWLFIAVIFIAGVVTGAALAMGLGPVLRHSPPPQGMNMQLMQRLTQELNLTPEQQAKIEPIVTNSANQMQAVRRDQFEQMSKIVDETNKAIAAILTPEQQQKLEKMQKEMDQRRDKIFPGHKHMWGGPQHGGPGGPPPGGPGQRWSPMPPDAGGPQGQDAPPTPPSSPATK